MKFDHFEYTIADHFVPVLINADYTGLEDADDVPFHNWLESTDRRITHWNVVTYGYDRCDVTGLFANCALVRGYFPEV